MALTLTYTGQTAIPVEVEGLLPTALRDTSIKEIELFEIFHGNRRSPLGEFFDMSGSMDDGELVFDGDLSGVHWIGAGMDSGTIRVVGDAGRHVGSQMTGGEIYVEGNAGDWVGGEMHGGFIHIQGGAGHLIGAAYRGSARGMTGGTILIGGDVGNEIGHTMRRGMLAVGGNCGDMTGFNMIAGNIFVFGNSGIRPGAAMRRGTLGLFGSEPPRYYPPFAARLRSILCIFKSLFGNFDSRDFPWTPSFLLVAMTFIMVTSSRGRGEIVVRSRDC